MISLIPVFTLENVLFPAELTIFAMQRSFRSMVFEHVNCRGYLRAVLASHVSENDSYSLRALAQKLGFAPSYLSSVLGGKKDLTTDAALRISMKLELTDLETQYLCVLAQYETESDIEYKSLLQQKLEKLNPKRQTYDLSIEAFRILSDWYHFAILELTQLKGFRFNPQSIADKLGLSQIEVEDAIERLKNLELLEEAPNGLLRKTSKYVLVNSSVPNSAIKKFHKQLLGKAVLSIDEQDPKRRFSSTDVIPIDERDLEALKNLINTFSEEVVKLSQKSKTKSHIYCVSVHGFDLIHSKGEKK